MEKMIGNVEGRLTGKVVYTKVQQDQETKNGKKFDSYQIGISLASGCTVFITNRVWEASRKNSNVLKRVEELENIIEQSQTEDVYVRLGLKPDKKTGENVFGKFTTYINKENNLVFNGEGYVSKIEHEIDDNNEVKLLFVDAKHNEYSVDFKKTDETLLIQGYVSKITDNTDIVVVDGKESYGASWNLTVSEEIGKQLVIGQAYAFKVKFERGEVIKDEQVKDDEDNFDFSADFSISSLTTKNKAKFGSNKLRVVSGGILKGQSIKIDNDNSSFSSAQDEELPF